MHNFDCICMQEKEYKIFGFIIDITKGNNEKLSLDDNLCVQRALGEDNFNILKVA